MTTSTDELIDGLYALPLEEFTSERNALAKRLKASGDTDAAAAVKTSAKPTLAAWAVNQLARSEADLMQELVSLQDRLASTASAKELRELTHKRRDLVTRLKSAAAGVLSNAGHGGGSSILQQISQTLLAGATEEEQELLLHGRLTRELSTSGLEQVWGLDPTTSGEDDEDDDEDARRRARREAEELTKQAAEAQQRAQGLAADVERLRAALADAEEAATTAREDAERLEDRAAEARRAAGLDA